MKTKTLILAFSLAIMMPAVGQKYMADDPNSSLEIIGTSTIHDWVIVAKDMSGEAKISTENDQLKIDDLNFVVKVNSLQSGKNSMDKNTREALKSELFPTLVYRLNNAEVIEEDGKSFKLNTTGVLTVAGASKTITMPVNALKASDYITFSGDITFKMTDFKVDPPTALMGTIKTDDEITIDFNVKYKIN